MTLRSQLPLSTATDVSAAGNLVFVGRSASGVSIVDASDPAHPELLATWKHPTLPQVTNAARALGSMLYVSNEVGGPYGLFALDISDPRAPALVSLLGPPAFPANVHNLWADDHQLYLAGYGMGGGNVIVDVSNPATPVRLTAIPTGFHDNTVIGHYLYVAAGYDGFTRYDITNPALPVAEVTYNSSDSDTSYYAHIAWPIDERYVFASEEVQIPPAGFGPGSFRVLDFGKPKRPSTVFRWTSEHAKDDHRITAHNVYVHQGFAYLSYYQDGVRVLDVSDPREPVEVAWYDTYPEPVQTLFEGCWGVYPFAGPDRIYASDRTHGLFVLAFNGARKGTLQGTVRDAVTLEPIPGAGITSLTAERSTFADQQGHYVLKTGAGSHTLRATAVGYHPRSEEVTLAPLATSAADFLLLPTSIPVAEEAAPAVSGLTLRLAPNPAPGGRTGIAIRVPPDLAGRSLTLAIYGPEGSRRRLLVRGAAVPGVQVAPWDGRDDGGHALPAGVYFVRIAAGSRTTSTKLVLAR
jgi:choice-of-anchor B domain-containing protein